MRRQRYDRRYVLATLLLAACAGKEHSPPAPLPPREANEVGVSRVWLQADDDEDALSVTVHYARGADSAGARVAEIVIDRSPELDLLSFETGAAADHAGKDVVVQEANDKQLRVLLFSPSSVTELEAGVLATIRLRHPAGARGELDLNTDKPLFAPAPANEGLAIGEPVQLD